MQKFKMLASVDKTYEQQGEIFFRCRNYDSQPEEVREKIRSLCTQAAGENSEALFHYLTTNADWQMITVRFYISDSTLQRCRKRFYELW